MYYTSSHPYNLTREDVVYAHFDRFHRGLGNNSCGADQALGASDLTKNSKYAGSNGYQIPTTGTYTYTLRFTPSTK